MTTKIIYHQAKRGVDCADGICAAWVAHRAHPEAEVIGCWYQCEPEDLPAVNPGDHLIIVDFSFPAETLKRWEMIGASITLIDHHKTAQEHLLGATETLAAHILFDMAECGATLTWKHFFPGDEIPRFLFHVKDETYGILSCMGHRKSMRQCLRLGESLKS